MEGDRICERVDLDAIERNAHMVQGSLRAGTKLAFVLKANAYGHGAVPLASALADAADYFAVADVAEAVELRRAGIATPILVLGGAMPTQFQTALAYDLTLAVCGYDRVKELSALATRLDRTARVHFAIDTGMGRIGWRVNEKDAEKAAAAAHLSHIYAEGIFSHYSCADCEEDAFSNIQYERFCRFLELLRERGITFPLRHMNNSAAALSAYAPLDMVRLGIALYGVYPSAETRARCGEVLSPAMSLVAQISYVKTVPEGCEIGYGAAFVTPREMRVATVTAGYGDGYPRALSQNGEVLIRGRRCPILGRICMDQMMVDVGGVPEARAGDTVTLLGTDGGETITAEELAARIGTIAYELLCGISRRVPRLYRRNGKTAQRVSYLDS